MLIQIQRKIMQNRSQNFKRLQYKIFQEPQKHTMLKFFRERGIN
jgi:hypothetical protein